MNTEGRLIIELGRDRANIVSGRRTDLARLMIGRDPGEVPDLLPRLFALCGEAHRSAAKLALSGRCGEGQMCRTAAETAREHLLRILMGWRVAGDAPLPAAPVMALVGTAHAGDEAARVLEQYLRTHILGCMPEAFLRLTDIHGWLEGANLPPARFLRRIASGGRAGLGVVKPAFLPDLPTGDLVRRMDTPGFIARPEWDGPRETGPLARCHAHPLVTSVIAEYGAGLLARLVARLVELAGIPEEIRAARPVTGAPGMGVVETARGRLIHAANVRNGKITGYTILAPTEWNFHPEGVAARALAGLDISDAGAMVEAIDPCVDFELRAA
ncbi:MAG TPA: hypothetical protein ENJ91_12665 [Rhodobacteraceae bacterium]|nr:hypothetical protein [Paracoccaceae bacterium]